MKAGGMVMIALLALGVLAIAVTGPRFMVDLIPGRDENHIQRPHCDQLWSDTEIAAAIESRPDLVEKLVATGDGVTVAISHPCEDEPDKAVITVGFQTNEEWDAITEILPNDGFGAPIEVVRL